MIIPNTVFVVVESLARTFNLNSMLQLCRPPTYWFREMFGFCRNKYALVRRESHPYIFGDVSKPILDSEQISQALDRNEESSGIVLFRGCAYSGPTSAVGDVVRPVGRGVAQNDPVRCTVQHSQSGVARVLGVCHVSVVGCVARRSRRHVQLWTQDSCNIDTHTHTHTHTCTSASFPHVATQRMKCTGNTACVNVLSLRIPAYGGISTVSPTFCDNGDVCICCSAQRL